MAEELPWQHLPEDPRAFFGLEADFDRRQLKRRYGEYIRRYRPETHPDEFQRIRAAYEQLEHGLRYRDVAPIAPPEAPPEEPLVPPSASPPASPADRYRELRGRSRKSAGDYWCLTVLSDVVETPPGESFDYWLVEGTARHPASLHRLMLERCRDPARRPVPEEVLEHIAARLPAAGFYATTERVWIHRFRREPLEEVSADLTRCEERLGSVSPIARSIFVLRLLPIALCRDPEGEWTQRTLRWIDEHGAHLPDGLDEEILWIDALLRYAEHREELLNGSRVRAALDRLITVASVEDELTAQHELHALHSRLADQPEALRRAFPFRVERDPADAIWPIWTLLTYRLSNESLSDDEIRPTKATRAAALVMLGRIERRTNRSALGVLWSLYGIVAIVSLIALLTVLPAWPLAVAGLSGYGIVLIVLAWAIFTYVVIKPRFLDRWHARIVLAFAKRAYRQVWRREVFDFTAHTLATPEQTARVIAQVRTDDHSNAQLLIELLGADLGLALYALALRATNE